MDKVGSAAARDAVQSLRLAAARAQRAASGAERQRLCKRAVSRSGAARLTVVAAELPHKAVVRRLVGEGWGARAGGGFV